MAEGLARDSEGTWIALLGNITGSWTASWMAYSGLMSDTGPDFMKRSQLVTVLIAATVLTLLGCALSFFWIRLADFPPSFLYPVTGLTGLLLLGLLLSNVLCAVLA